MSDIMRERPNTLEGIDFNAITIESLRTISANIDSLSQQQIDLLLARIENFLLEWDPDYHPFLLNLQTTLKAKVKKINNGQIYN